MDPNQPKTSEQLPTTFPSPSILGKLDKSINSNLEGLKVSTSIEEQEKLASELWLNLLHKEANLRALDFSHKIEFLKQQPPSFLSNCDRIWGTMVNSAKEKATLALASISHSLEEMTDSDRDSYDLVETCGDEISNADNLLSEIGKILDNFKVKELFAEASSDLPDRKRVDSTKDHNKKRQKILKTEDPPVSEDSHSSNELLEKVKNSIKIDEQKKLASDLWLELLCIGASSTKSKPKIKVSRQPTFLIKCEDLCTKLVESARRKVSVAEEMAGRCYIDPDDGSFYDYYHHDYLNMASCKIKQLIKILEELDMNKVFTEVLQNP